jgi:hypothetical protein
VKSQDYLYEILKPHKEEGWYVEGKRYTIVTTLIKGSWKEAVASCFRDQLSVIGGFYDSAEEAWEVFLTARYPKVMRQWVERESAT